MKGQIPITTAMNECGYIGEEIFVGFGYSAIFNNFKERFSFEENGKVSTF
jgi:hypothetical protein